MALSCSFLSIPNELLLIIADFCDTPSLARLTQTCKGFHLTLSSDKTKRAKQEVLLPADFYRQNFVYKEGQIPGIDRPLRLLTDNTLSDRAIWDQAMSRRVYSRREGRLVRAVQRGKLSGVRALLEMSINPNSYDCSGVWVLNMAVNNGDMDMVDLLLSYGANPNVKDIPCEKNILDYAHDDFMTQRLILAGAHLSEPRDIQNIIDRRSIETIAMVMERMRADSLRMPSLVLFAATRGDRDILSLILSQPERHSILNEVRIYEGSALHTVIKNGKEELAWMLIAAGIDINLTSSDGTTALHLALQKKSFHLARELIEAGCALNCVTREGQTELHFAVQARSVEMVRLLLSKGVDVDLRGPSNRIRTPVSVIHDAIRGGDRDIVRAILTEGSRRPDLSIADYGLADTSGNSEILQMLVEFLKL